MNFYVHFVDSEAVEFRRQFKENSEFCMQLENKKYTYTMIKSHFWHLNFLVLKQKTLKVLVFGQAWSLNLRVSYRFKIPRYAMNCKIFY